MMPRQRREAVEGEGAAAAGGAARRAIGLSGAGAAGRSGAGAATSWAVGGAAPGSGIGPGSGAAPGPGLEDYAGGTGSAARHLGMAREVRGLADRLLALPRSERLLAVEKDRRYHDLGLAKLFTLEAEEALFDPAGDAEPAAELAAAIAFRLPGAGGGKVGRTTLLAHWLLGKALLRRGSLEAAEVALQVTFAYIPGGRPSQERGLACYAFAQLDADMGRLDDALGLGLVAAFDFFLLGAEVPAAACYAQVGLLEQEAGDLERAAADLKYALRFLDGSGDPGLAPSLTARVLLALAEVEVTLGGGARAAWQHLRRARRLYRLGCLPGESVEHEWREAKAAAAAGRLAEAEGELDGVRRQLLAAGSLAEAVRATLDQAQLRLDVGRAAGVEELAGDLKRAFPGDGAGGGAEGVTESGAQDGTESGAQGFGGLIGAEGDSAGEPWAWTIARIGRLAGGPSGEMEALSRWLRRRLRLRPPRSPERPPLIVPWRTLTDRLLRGHRECGGGESPAPPPSHPPPPPRSRTFSSS